MLAEGRFVGDDFPWMTDEDRASYARVEQAFARAGQDRRPRRPLVAPGGRAARPALDRRLDARRRRDAERRPCPRARRAGALLRVGRAHLAALGAAQGGGRGRGAASTTYETWEAERVAEGSANGAAANGRGGRSRPRPLLDPGRADPGRHARAARYRRCGERFEAAVVVSAVPGRPAARHPGRWRHRGATGSLRRQRHALAAKAVFAYDSSFWERQGQNGELYSEIGLIGGAWPQVDGVLSTLVPPERLAPLIATPEEVTERGADRGDGRRLRRGAPRDARPSSCAAGASTPGPRATSPPGARAT